MVDGWNRFRCCLSLLLLFSFSLLFPFLLFLPGSAEQAPVLRGEFLSGPQGLLLDRGEARAPVFLEELAVDLLFFSGFFFIQVRKKTSSPSLSIRRIQTTKRERTSHSGIFA